MARYLGDVSEMVAARVQPRARDLARRFVLIAVAGLLLLVGAGFLIGAGVIALAGEVGMTNACLIVGGALVLIALILLLLSRRRRVPMPPPAPPPPPPAWMGIAGLATTAALSDILGSRRRAVHWAPVALALGALAVGAVIDRANRRKDDLPPRM